jgi:flagella basal body P-ring formation protein FlgA
MRSNVILLFFCLLFYGGTSLASEPTTRITEKITEEIPASLGVASLSLRAAIKQIEGPISLTWKTPPKEGFSDVEVKYTLKNKERTVWARVELRPLQTVLVATRSMALGETISAGDFVLEKRPVRSGGWLSIEPTIIAGTTLQRSIDAGDIATEDEIQLPKPIARGTTLKVISQLGGVKIATTGTLEKQARPGEKSSARLSDGKLVQGQLQDESTFIVGAK